MTERFHYGGQAVIEGVMIRGRKTMAITVRRPDGELATDIRPLPSIYTGRIRRTPLLRGVIILIESMVLGIRSLLYSANVSLEEEGEEISGGLAWIMVAVSLVFGVALFFIIPLFLTRLFNISSVMLFNLVDGIIRVTIFIIYLRLMTLVPDIKQVFAYHGAEHKVVNAYEAGLSLEVDAVKGEGTAHARCGTSFLFVVLIISIFAFALTGINSPWQMVVSRLVLLPLIAALSYEIIYLGARHMDNVFVRAVLAPGMWLQALTTREPDDGQIEVALSALNAVVEADQPEEAAQTSS